jgi:uncharacterized protein (DUF1501 family)
MNRRDMLKQMGSLAALMALAERGEAQFGAANVTLRNTARACIFVYLNGAPSHLDTFDPKDGPWNPADADIQRYPGGIALSRTLFPKFSQLTADLCVLRSVKSWEAAHERGVFYMQTFHPSNPAFVSETPHMGALVALERGNTGPMPPFLSLNQGGVLVQGSKFLGGQYAPLAAPANQGGLATLEHNFFGAQSRTRFENRFSLLEQLDAEMRTNPPDQSMGDHAAFYGAARRMVYDPAIANVFRFDAAENTRYGNTNIGRAAIVARNAIQAKNGTVFVALHHNGWDTHADMFNRAAPTNMYTLTRDLDTAVGTLVEDLKASGDFAETLIVLMGEFGRTPGPLNARGGRDHHRDAMSVVMMGGGIRGGKVIGATDAIGETIIDPGWSRQRPIYVEDIASTLYTALGINWTKSIQDTPSGRKLEYVPYAEEGVYGPVEEVFA